MKKQQVKDENPFSEKESSVLSEGEQLSGQGQLTEKEGLISQLIAERDELKDQLLRALADLQNFKKRWMVEKEEIRKHATEKLVSEIIPVLDNFERTLAAVEAGASSEAIIEGVKMIDRQLRNVLSSVQLSKIDVTGAPFDPAHHEAIAAEFTEEHPEDTVIHVLEPGYKMAERVIRPAKVKVAKRKRP